MADEKEPKFRPVQVIESPDEFISAVKFNNRGSLVASCAWSPSINLWSFTDDRLELRTIMSGHEKGVSDIAFSSDDHQLASASNDKTVKLWDVARARCIRNFTGHQNFVFSLCFRKNLIISGSDDCMVKIWDIRKEPSECVRNIRFHSDRVTSVDFREHNILTGSLDERFAFHDIRTTRFITSKKLSAGVSHTRFTGKGRHFTVSTHDSIITLWDRKELREKRRYEGHFNADYSAFSDISPANTFLASGSEDRNVFLWFFDNQEIAQVLEGHKEAVLSVQFHPRNERFLVTGSLDGTVTLYKNEVSD